MGQRRLVTMHPVPGSLGTTTYEAVSKALAAAGVRFWLDYQAPDVVVMIEVDDP